MQRQVNCTADRVPTVEGIWPGTTTVADRSKSVLLAYVRRSASAIYIDPANMERVVGALRARFEGDRLLIPTGKTLAALDGMLLRCARRPWGALPLSEPVEVGDGSVLADRRCSLVEPFQCAHVEAPDRTFKYSFRAPDYGMSVCRLSPGDTCISWAAQEMCDTYAEPRCRPEPAVRQLVTAWVCSML
ncbi:MAG: hypothetical protein IPM22_14980 [Betaproteobacteria bacterium]|nr:hypothetical protein [Betaproteobacteria bacterium]